MEFRVDNEARSFARQLSELLNKTICNGVRLQAVVQSAVGVVTVGAGIGTDRLRAQPIPCTVDARAATLNLTIQYQLRADASAKFLEVESSTFVLTSVDGAELLHFDYERGKGDGYPEAHLQVVGESDAWTELCRRLGPKGRALSKLHIPVGGRRYRPTLEDVVEFLATEGLAVPRPGWKDQVDKGRREFHEKQLKAAVRRHPDIAREILRRIDTGELKSLTE